MWKLCVLTVAVLAAPIGASAQEMYRLELSLRIGSLDGDAALTRVRQARLLSDGSLVVAQPQERTLKVFDSQGTLRGVIGRRGDGPGEFRNITQIGVVHDTIWVADGMSRRLSFFTPSGDLVREITWNGHPRAPSTPLGNGRYSSIELSTNGDNRHDARRPWVTLAYNEDAVVIDTVAILHTETRPVTIAGRLMSPLSDGALSSYSPDGQRLVVVDRRAPDEAEAVFTITWITAEGDTLNRSQFKYTASPITDDIVNYLAARFAASGAPPAAVREARAVLEQGKYLSPVSAVVAVESGHVWIARERIARDIVRWHRIDVNGRALGYVELPAESRILAGMGDSIWVRELDELDVPYVARYRLMRSN